MAIIREYIRAVVTYSVLSTLCLHLLPKKSYRGYMGFAIGLVYLCMFLDLMQQIANL